MKYFQDALQKFLEQNPEYKKELYKRFFELTPLALEFIRVYAILHLSDPASPLSEADRAELERLVKYTKRILDDVESGNSS
jgi:hypothetical protein